MLLQNPCCTRPSTERPSCNRKFHNRFWSSRHHPWKQGVMSFWHFIPFPVKLLANNVKMITSIYHTNLFFVERLIENPYLACPWNILLPKKVNNLYIKMCMQHILFYALDQIFPTFLYIFLNSFCSLIFINSICNFEFISVLFQSL